MRLLPVRLSARFPFLLATWLSLALSLPIALGAATNTPPPHSASGGPASEEGSALAQAIAKLVALADEGEQLKVLREQLLNRLNNATAELEALPAAPGSDAPDVKKKAWTRQQTNLQEAVARAEIDLEIFDTKTLPAFKQKVEDAKRELANAQVRAAAKEEKRAKDASDKADATLAAIGSKRIPIQLKAPAKSK